MGEDAGQKCEREPLPQQPCTVVCSPRFCPPLSGKPLGVFDCLGGGERDRALQRSRRTGTCVGGGCAVRGTVPLRSGEECRCLRTN